MCASSSEMEIDASVLASLHLQYPLVRSINSNLSLKMIGLSSLKGLSDFTGVKSFDASNNNLELLEPAHISFMTDLRILKLQNNKISALPILACNPLLHTLDLSSNTISHLSNLSYLTSLRSLQLSNNRLSTVESLSDLASCLLLENLELNSNQIDDRGVLELLSTLPALKWLQMRGNPFALTVVPYRKIMVGTITQLVALDGEAVEERDRFFAAAFVSGGVEAESKARDTFYLKNKEREKRNREFLRSQLGSRKISAASRAASLDDFHGVTRRVLPQESENNCGICMQALNDECAHLSCSHEFHASCTLQWLSCSLHCPTCRTPVIATAVGHVLPSEGDTSSQPHRSQVGDAATCVEVPASSSVDDNAARSAAKRLLVEQRVAERRLQMALEKQGMPAKDASHQPNTSQKLSRETQFANPSRNEDAGQASSPVASPVLRGKGRGKLLQPSRVIVASEGGSGAAADHADVEAQGDCGGPSLGGLDAGVGDDGDSYVAELQRAHQADSSRQQRTLAALDKKLAKDEALLKSGVASMLEKRGEDASSSAVSSEVNRRRQAWESELQQFHAGRQQGTALEDSGRSGQGGGDAASQGAIVADAAAAVVVSAVADQASSPVLRGKGRGRCSHIASSQLMTLHPSAPLPLLVSLPPPTRCPLVPGLCLDVKCVVVAGASRCASSILAPTVYLQNMLEASVLCINPATAAFCARFKFQCVTGKATFLSASFPAVQIRPFDVVTLSTKNFPFVLSLEFGSAGAAVTAKITFNCHVASALPK
jgi:hypothetical protein